MEDSESPDSSIDIGLSDLLGEEPPSSFETVLKEEEKGAEHVSDLQLLWDQGRFEELINAAETPAEVSDNPILRKVWWIRGQTEFGQLPKQVLCSSLEECLSPDKIDNIPLALVEKTSLELAHRLTQAEEEGLAIAILERCFEVAPSGEVATTLLSLIAKELEDLPKRMTFHNPVEMKKRLHLLELKRSLEEFMKSVSDVFILGDSAPEENSEPAAPVVEPLQTKNSQDRNVFGLLLVILFFVTAWFGMDRYFDTTGQEQIAGNFTVRPDAKEEMMKPEVARIQDVSQLAALMYDVEKGDVGKSGNEQTQPVAQQAQVQQQVAAQPQPVRQKETINTSGPVETQKIKDLLDGREGGSKYDDAPAVRFPRDDRDLSRAPIVRDEREKDRDRQFDASRAQTWQGGDRYEVQINTSVMDGPSFHAHEVSELFVGDRILVEARVGRWLRLRSVKGKSGYILAQDAEKLYD